MHHHRTRVRRRLPTLPARRVSRDSAPAGHHASAGPHIPSSPHVPDAQAQLGGPRAPRFLPPTSRQPLRASTPAGTCNDSVPAIPRIPRPRARIGRSCCHDSSLSHRYRSGSGSSSARMIRRAASNTFARPTFVAVDGPTERCVARARGGRGHWIRSWGDHARRLAAWRRGRGARDGREGAGAAVRP